VIRIDWRDAGNAFEFSVSDNGPGIEPEYHERIWGIFQTLAPRDKVEGTGIGLSVVRKIVESRDGSVSLESSPGQGAIFRFIWPKKFLKEPGA
jgi:signal transduction histidine kinase